MEQVSLVIRFIGKQFAEKGMVMLDWGNYMVRAANSRKISLVCKQKQQHHPRYDCIWVIGQTPV